MPLMSVRYMPKNEKPPLVEVTLVHWWWRVKVPDGPLLVAADQFPDSLAATRSGS